MSNREANNKTLHETRDEFHVLIVCLAISTFKNNTFYMVDKELS